MKNWFPLTASRMENATYQKLTATERLYLEYIISEYSRRGSFYQSDLEIAVILGMSVDKIREARRKVGTEPESVRLLEQRRRGVECPGGYGWIVYKHGWKHGARCLATQYLDVPIAERKKGDWYAAIPRYTFESMLSEIRNKHLTHADVVVWLVLAYKFWRCKGKGNEEERRFFITKKELMQLSGIVSAAASVPRLYEAFEAINAEGQPESLFYFTDQCQRFTFKQWTWFLDPNDNKSNAESQRAERQRVAAMLSEKKAAMQKKEKQRQRKAANTCAAM